MDGVRRARQTDTGVDTPPWLVGLSTRKHAKSDFPGQQGGDTLLSLQLDAIGRHDRRDGHDVLLLDVRFPQRQLECCQPLAMDADTARQKEAFRDKLH